MPEANYVPNPSPGSGTEPSREYGGGSGSGSQELFIDRSPSAPDDPTMPALNFNTQTGVITYWVVETQTWQ